MEKNLQYYIDCFSNLHTAKSKGKPAPHKALLLLTILDMIEQGDITSNRIEISDDMLWMFPLITRRYLGNSTIFKPNIGMPYYHMQSEPFWELVEDECFLMRVAEEYHGDKIYVKSPSASYSVNALKKRFSYAKIDNELLSFMQNPDSAAKLRVTLIKNYLAVQPTTNLPIPAFTLSMIFAQCISMIG